MPRRKKTGRKAADPVPGSVTVIRERACAKLNLYLHVTGRRADGYHLLDSLVAFAGIGDVLTLSPGEGGIAISLTGPFAAAVPAGEDNLVHRALRDLAASCGRTADVQVNLEKTLPVAAGIGGGSADAAAALRAAARLWQVANAAGPCAEIAGRLGADVPMCLRSRPAVVSGVGDVIDRTVAVPPAFVVLVNPGFPVATPDVFHAYDGLPPRHGDAAPFDFTAGDLDSFVAALAARENHLEAAALTLHPEISRVLAYLRACEGCMLARMSGSGATCFGLFADADGAHRAADGVRRGEPEWWAAAAPLEARGTGGDRS